MSYSEPEMHKAKKLNLHYTESVLAGVGAFLGLSLIGLLAEKANMLMIIAPFGATAVLLFSAPHSPFSRPLNIFGGYFISTLIGLCVLEYTTGGWLPIGIGLGITIMMMHLLKVVHPPAGANFLIVTQGHLSLHLIWPLFIGLIALILVGISIDKLQKKINVSE